MQNMLESLEDSAISDISSSDLDHETESAMNEFMSGPSGFEGDYSSESSSDSPTGM